MKYAILILLCGVFSIKGHSQIDSLKTINLDVELLVNNLDKTKSEINLLFEENNIVPDLFNENNNQFFTEFVLAQETYYTFVDEIEDWGLINSRKIESVNFTEKLNNVNLEIERIKVEIDDYNSLLKKIDIKSESHVKYWEKLEFAKDNLRKQRDIQKEFLDSNKKFKVKLKVREENFLTNEPDFSFVNMPGIQYSFFIPANSDGEYYPQNMNGYSLKYLLNRRKTFLEMGLFKSITSNENSLFDELYKFGWGQDIYSTHLGRGARKSLNLYSGFKAGIFILTGKEDNLISWYVTPSLGLEIYKVKNILIDTKMGYFLPFKENRNMRGLLMETSFNVVF
jgi:hypothetical protein